MTDEKRDVFISYTSADRSAANRAKAILESNGITCWMAPESIQAGLDYAQSIPAAIESCGVFLLMLSQNAQRSIWVPKEIDTALNCGKVVIPFHIDDSALEKDYNFKLTNVQRIEAFNRGSEAYGELIDTIRSILGVRRDIPVNRSAAWKKQSPDKRKRMRIWAAAVIALILLAAAAALLWGIGSPKGKAYGIGDKVLFGAYEQDGDPSDGKEAIQWTVLDVRDGKALLLSDKVLDSRAYHDEHVPVTWADCSLRLWLNGKFLRESFTADERERIVRTRLVNSDNAVYGTRGGSDTEDEVFLLSLDEVEEYFDLFGIADDWGLGVSDSLICTGTLHALARGLAAYTLEKDDIAYQNKRFGGTPVSDQYEGSVGCWWWLRSPGMQEEGAAVVDEYGCVYTAGGNVEYDVWGVRPAMWIRNGR